jgi:hypothetical protein
VDWDGTVLGAQKVEHGSGATPPANPTRTGYTFLNWDVGFSNIVADLTVTAQYSINFYTVDFVDWNDEVLKTESVTFGSGATAPVNPDRPGYTFTGWAPDYSNITGALTVKAQYSINKYTVTFVDWNDTVIGTQEVGHGSSAAAPANPTREGYTFTGWDVNFSNVTSNLTVTAVYTGKTITNAEFLQERASGILKNGLNQDNLRLNGKILTLVIDGREFVLSTNANNLNISGEINIGDGYYLVFDIKGNGSNIKDFRIIRK